MNNSLAASRCPAGSPVFQGRLLDAEDPSKSLFAPNWLPVSPSLHHTAVQTQSRCWSENFQLVNVSNQELWVLCRLFWIAVGKVLLQQRTDWLVWSDGHLNVNVASVYISMCKLQWKQRLWHAHFHPHWSKSCQKTGLSTKILPLKKSHHQVKADSCPPWISSH